MTNWILKLSVAGVAVVVAIVLLAHLGGGSIALADVLEHVQDQSYSFNLTVRVDDASTTLRGMVYQQGRTRFDGKVGAGTVSTITDLHSRQCLLLFHQFKTARYMDGSEELTNTGADKLLLLCARPIEHLWYLRDGTEEDLGEENVDGVKARGFRVVHEDEYFQNEITLWAEANSGRPVTVEVVSTALKPPRGQLVFTLADFDVETDLPESLFSLEVPPGYALSDQTNLQDIEFNDQTSEEAQKITDALRLWKNNESDEAIRLLLSVKWDEPITFAEEPYIFTLTEQAIVELKQAQRDQLMPVVLDSCNRLRKLCFALVERAKEARSNQEHAEAEGYLVTALRLGELVNRDPEGMFIVQLVGIAMRKLSLVQLKSLYEEMDAPEKLVAIEQKIQQVDADHQMLRNRTSGR